MQTYQTRLIDCLESDFAGNGASLWGASLDHKKTWWSLERIVKICLCLEWLEDPMWITNTSSKMNFETSHLDTHLDVMMQTFEVFSSDFCQIIIFWFHTNIDMYVFVKKNMYYAKLSFPGDWFVSLTIWTHVIIFSMLFSSPPN